MVLTAAEKQRRYREKLKKDPAKYEESKRKLREHYHKNKKLVGDLSAPDKRNARMIWKLRKRHQRQRTRQLIGLLNETPPGTPSPPPGANNDEVPIHRFIRAQGSISPISIPRNSPNIKQGRKKVRRDRTKVYKENQKLASENEKLKTKLEKYKKRYHRLKKYDSAIDSNKENRKYKLLTRVISRGYKNIKKLSEKRILKRILTNPILQRSNMRGQVIKDSLQLSGPMRISLKSNEIKTELQVKIEKFFMRDDISRNTAGKKETVTKGKEKVQKRYILDTMKNLYVTFKTENPNVKCSYFYFTRNRPWYIKTPSIDGREMCLCKIHANTLFKASALQAKKVLQSKDLSQIIRDTVCDSNKQECMYGLCQICSEKKIHFDAIQNDGSVEFYEWIRKEEKYIKDGKAIKAIKNVKEKKESKILNLIRDFEIEMAILKKHVYNMKTQYQNFRRCVDELKIDEVVILADFSENYNCKYNAEVQAHHFGGSRQQLTLHTVMVYTRDKDDIINAQSFCTVSSCNLHQPAAIWAHLHPVLHQIKNNFPGIKILHFFSDGPFTQYRQKQNFYFACTKPFEYGFEAVTWSFFEAGHGKGPADGIGGYLKRTADGIVARGQDIANIDQFIEALKDISKVELFVIKKEEIDIISNQLPKKIEILQGTLHVHQLFTTNYGELKYRTLSCFCKRGFCNCLAPKNYRPVKPTITLLNDTVHAPHLSSVDSPPWSSADEMPLSQYTHDRTSISKSSRSPIDYADLSAKIHRTNIYDIVYDSGDASGDEKNQPSCSYKRNKIPHSGNFLLVKVHTSKKQTYTYASKAITDIEDDGEFKVMFLRAVKSNTKFRQDEKDVAYVGFEDVIQILPQPKLLCGKSQLYYEFAEPVDIFEQ